MPTLALYTLKRRELLCTEPPAEIVGTQRNNGNNKRMKQNHNFGYQTPIGERRGNKEMPQDKSTGLPYTRYQQSTSGDDDAYIKNLGSKVVLSRN